MPDQTKQKKTADNNISTLIIRGRLTKKPYTFKRIKSREEILDLFYSQPEIPNKEAHALVTEIREITAQNNEEHEKLRTRGILEPANLPHVRIPISYLEADPRIARENLIDWPHVADIAQDITLDALGNPVVHVMRIADKNGKFVRWAFILLDWTHRCVWAIDEGYNTVKCAVRIVDDIAESARVMHKINRDVRRQNVIDSMRTRVVGEHPKIMQLIKILDEYQFKPQLTGTRTILKHGTIGLTKLEKLYDQFGEAVVYRILDWLSTRKFVGWDTQATACSPDVIHGLALLAAAEKNGFVHTELIDAVLATNSPESVVNQANNELSMRQAEDLYGAPVSGKSEEGRAKRIFCVLLKQVQQRLGTGRLKLKSPHIGTFRTLMNCYYKSQSKNAATRQRTTRKVWSLRKQLHAAKAGDYFFDPVEECPANSTRLFTR